MKNNYNWSDSDLEEISEIKDTDILTISDPIKEITYKITILKLMDFIKCKIKE